MLDRIARSVTTIILTLSLVAPSLAAAVPPQGLSVTGVSLRPEVAKNVGGCPVTVNFNGLITAKGRGTVKYRFIRSDGATSGVRTLDFADSGSQPVTTTWTLGDAALLPFYEGWQAVQVLSPNELESSHTDGAFVVSCGKAANGGTAPPQTPTPTPTPRQSPNTNAPRPNSENYIPPFAREAEVRLDKLVYAAGDTVSATVTANRELITKENLQVVVASPDTKDVEVLQLTPAGDADTYVTAGGLRVEAAAGAGPEPNNGRLTARPNEIIVAMFFPVRGEQGLEKVKRNAFGRDDAGMLSDVAVIEDEKFQGSPLKVDPRLAMTEDERQVPENGKRIGTLAVEGGLALQVPLDELIIYPRDGRQLKKFLEETRGSVLLDGAAADPNGRDDKTPRGYLVRVNTARADTAHLSQLRALFGEKETLLASSPEALQIVALATQYRLDGFVVAVNPRLQFMSAPSTRDSGAPVIDAIGPSGSPRVFADDRFGVRRAWAYTALWDADTRRIPVAILDMGFAPNWDFRGFPSGIFQCNLEDRNLGDLLSGRVPCAPGAAVGPPTVGNSFFGATSWHGTGVVTTAGGVLNNGWGSAGTGGQVVEPRLYKTGLRSYAFEMGLGMRKATDDGAAIINISAGYPCTVVPTVGPDLTICDPAQRAALCALVSVAVHTAAALVCATAGIIPIFGIIACVHAHDVAAATTVACFATLLIGDPRGPLQDGVNFARARGATVISIAGNQQSRASLGALCDVINCGPQDATRWRVVPGTLPGVICAGAADNSSPYLNTQFFGPDVALWAPIGSTYFHPPSTASVVGPEGQVPDVDSFGGTSAAAPYIAGVAAMMEAVNPNLNPRNPSLTAAQRAAIPDIIRATLVGTATPASALPFDPTGQRRNLIDAFRAVKAAATLSGSGVIPDFDARGYDATLGFDETSSTSSFDTPTTGRFVSYTDSARQFTGTILAIPAGPGPGPGGVNFTDRDWYRVQMPPGPEGLYRRVVRLTQPRRDRFGAVLINEQPGRLFASLPGGLEEVWEYEVTGTDGSNVEVMLHGSLNSDNVYKVQFLAPVRVGARPRPDRFDRPEDNPPSRPNNDESARATPLGTGDTAWRDATPGGATTGVNIMEVNVPDLSLHTGGDQDWFTVPLPAGGPRTCSRCSPTLTITTGPGVTINVYDSRGGAVGGPRTSPAMLTCADYRGRGPLRILVSSAGGGPVNYDLRITWTDSSSLCDFLGGFIWGDLYEGQIIHLIPLGDPAPDRLSQMDNAGRVITPALYAVPWRGQGKFVLQARVAQGQSLALQLLDARGKVVAQSATPDLARQFKVTQQPNADAETSTLKLEAGALKPGVYYLAVSHVKPRAEVDITIP